MYQPPDPDRMTLDWDRLTLDQLTLDRYRLNPGPVPAKPWTGIG